MRRRRRPADRGRGKQRLVVTPLLSFDAAVARCETNPGWNLGFSLGCPPWTGPIGSVGPDGLLPSQRHYATQYQRLDPARSLADCWQDLWQATIAGVTFFDESDNPIDLKVAS
jgi:hypothetical protein